jgi:beta-phosphoglucomutase
MGHQIKGIIFDMDGVLLYSSAIHERAYREALADLPIREFCYSNVAGMRTDEALRVILADNNMPCTPELIGALAATKRRLARELIRSQNPVAPGCVEVLGRLAGKYRLALASSASKATIDLFLRQNGLLDRFASVLHGGDVLRAKPDPEIYELACRRIGLPPGDCLIIEDAVSGVLAGKAARAIVWGISATCSAEELQKAGADRVIDRLEDILPLLDGR